MKKPHHTARAGLTYNMICTDTMKFNGKAIKAQLIQDFEKAHPYWKDHKDEYQFAPHQTSYAERELVREFFGEYDELLKIQCVQQQQECVGGKGNPEENVTKESETNENARKKTFSHDTTKKG